MVHTATAWGDVVTALVGGMRDVPGYRSPWSTSGTGVPVYDSAEYMLTDDIPGTVLVIGYIGQGRDQLSPAGDAPQSVAKLGTLKHRDEAGTVRCLISASSGNFEAGSVPALRDVALTVLDDLDTYLRATQTLGLVPDFQLLRAQLVGLPDIRPYPTDDGPVFDVEVSVGYDARI